MNTEVMRQAVAAEDLKNNTRGLEDINNQIENTANPEMKESLFRKAEQIEAELDQIEKIMGISAEEMLSFYEAITPEDARDIVTKTIEKIPLGFMRGVLWTTDNLKQYGGKIMLWASIKSPREAAIIAASVMILTLGGGVAQEAIAGEETPVTITHMSEANPAIESVADAAQDNLAELETVHTSAERLAKVRRALNNMGPSDYSGGIPNIMDADRADNTGKDATMNSDVVQVPAYGKIHTLNEDGLLVPDINTVDQLPMNNMKYESNKRVGAHKNNALRSGYDSSNMTVNGEAVQVLEDNDRETIYGNSSSIHSQDVHMGTISIKK